MQLILLLGSMSCELKSKLFKGVWGSSKGDTSSLTMAQEEEGVVQSNAYGGY